MRCNFRGVLYFADFMGKFDPRKLLLCFIILYYARKFQNKDYDQKPRKFITSKITACTVPIRYNVNSSHTNCRQNNFPFQKPVVNNSCYMYTIETHYILSHLITTPLITSGPRRSIFYLFHLRPV